MIPLALIDVVHDGRKLECFTRIPGEAHAVGLTPVAVKRARVFPGEELYERGADLVFDLIVEGAVRVRTECRGAWGLTGPLF